MKRISPATIALIAAGIIALLLIAYTFAGLRSGRNPDKLDDKTAVAARPSDPAKRCASQATYDLIKRELFRRAAALRGSDQAAFDRLSTYAVVRMNRAVLKSNDADTGTLSCAGTLSLDLPPGVAVVGGRRTLGADIGFELQRAADGSGDVLTLTDADPIVTPLATLERSGAASSALPQPLPPQASQAPIAVSPVGPETTAPPRPQPSAPSVSSTPPAAVAAPTSVRPGFNCAYARTAGEIAICRSPMLSGLDRQMLRQFSAALGASDPDQRSLLYSTRSRFLHYREWCRTDDCIAAAYRGRMNEIRDIMAGDWRGSR